MLYRKYIFNTNVICHITCSKLAKQNSISIIKDSRDFTFQSHKIKTSKRIKFGGIIATIGKRYQKTSKKSNRSVVLALSTSMILYVAGNSILIQEQQYNTNMNKQAAIFETMERSDSMMSSQYLEVDKQAQILASPSTSHSIYDELNEDNNYMVKTTAMEELVKLLLKLFSFFIITISMTNILNTVISNVIAKKREYSILQAVGMSKKQLIQLLSYEYGTYIIKTWIVTTPISIIISYVSYVLLFSHHYGFIFPMTLLIQSLFISVLLMVVALVTAWHFVHRQSLIENINNETI